ARGGAPGLRQAASPARPVRKSPAPDRPAVAASGSRVGSARRLLAAAARSPRLSAAGPASDISAQAAGAGGARAAAQPGASARLPRQATRPQAPDAPGFARGDCRTGTEPDPRPRATGSTVGAAARPSVGPGEPDPSPAPHRRRPGWRGPHAPAPPIAAPSAPASPAPRRPGRRHRRMSGRRPPDPPPAPAAPPALQAASGVEDRAAPRPATRPPEPRRATADPARRRLGSRGAGAASPYEKLGPGRRRSSPPRTSTEWRGCQTARSSRASRVSSTWVMGNRWPPPATVSTSTFGRRDDGATAHRAPVSALRILIAPG